LIKILKKLLSKIVPPQEKAHPTAASDVHHPETGKQDAPGGGTISAAGGEQSPEPASKPKRRRRPAAAKPAAEPQALTPVAPPWDPSSFKVAPAEGRVRFHDLDLPDPLMHAIADLGFEYCTPIQAEILPSTLTGRDAAGRAQTGTGKTAAFLITVLTRMLRSPLTTKPRKGAARVLVLGPTRELVMQIAEEAKQLAKYTDMTVNAVFGGMDYDKQRRQLAQARTDIIVATPGRLLDFKRQGDLHLDQVETLIIDEADRMLDMGFVPDVRRIIQGTPQKGKRQTLLFSATLTPEVTRLAAQWTTDPVTVEIEPSQVAVDTVEQLVYIVTRGEKFALLYNIITRQNLERVIVFCNRKDETRRLADLFVRYNIDCAVLSGDIRQSTRVRTLNDFKAGKIRMLVATDVAGRGIHIEGMAHVINYTLPRDPEDYVHRIGRTGRAGAAGTSISFADEEDSFVIPAIENLIGNPLPCLQPEEDWLVPPPPPPATKRKPRAWDTDAQDGASAGRGRKRTTRPRGPRSPVKRGR
jgi:ATP-dependent RNA helicase RhlB